MLELEKFEIARSKSTVHVRRRLHATTAYSMQIHGHLVYYVVGHRPDEHLVLVVDKTLLVRQCNDKAS